ncbi:NitT/TauT family transport system permease protein [Microbacteriaceae bacterium SG_E_30_P1]|uniref:NitT/TauT family transport system permease protein n=1 Tax=Antiquaquibacter oligotrophicus TaxID=2880260 RepID=A0ABT6KM29_9MICO|nr:ABC transporter permease [Antiquaquibacter oligotrophicus]MDH6181068.1 NitT/TauT family transport system permease protein [Antiquaquibacter oligotrophicus]UDF13234.1 ABC transporter permease [Antiquaquibacter oligotrophicus]
MSILTHVRRRTSLPAWVMTAIVVGAVLLIWQLAVVLLGVSPNILPTPSQIAVDANWPVVLESAASTILATLAGFAVGNLVGLALAILICASRTFSDIVYPIAVVVRAIPVVALAPFITLAFGRGPGATVVVAALIVFFPTLVNVILGLRSVPREAIELLAVINASTIFGYLAVRIPFAMPAFVSALKISAPNAVLGVMTAEWIIGGSGLGRLVVQSWLSLDITTMWAAVILSAIVASALFSVVSIAERLLLGWAVRT